MKRTAMIVAAALLLVPGTLFAQMHGGMAGQQMMGTGQHEMGPGMQRHMGMMGNMMARMQSMLSTGELSPAQQRRMAEIMRNMSGVMKEMSMHQQGEYYQKHQNDIQEMRDSLDELDFHVGH